MTAALALGRVAAFREVLPPSFEVTQPPRFIFGTLPAEIAAHLFARLQLPAVGVYTCREVELSDGFVLRHEGDPLEATDCKLLPKHLEDAAAGDRDAFGARPRRRLPGRSACVVLPGYKFYGTWLTEILPRLAVLEADGARLRTLTFPVPADTPAFGLELLQLCGVPKNRMFVYGKDEVLQPDEMLVPTLMHNGVRYAPLIAEAAALFRHGVEKAGHNLSSSSAPARIYLTRAGFGRRLTNRDKLQAMAEAAGFITVQPEKMSLPEQIAMFANAREIAGEYGSAFHTALFSPPGTIVCGLRGSQIHPGFLQSAIGAVLEQPTGYVFGQSGTGKQPADYSVEESHFAECLRSVFSPRANLSARASVLPKKEKPAPFPPPDRLNYVPPRRSLWEVLGKRPAAPDGPVAPGSLFEDLLKTGDGK